MIKLKEFDVSKIYNILYTKQCYFEEAENTSRLPHTESIVEEYMCYYRNPYIYHCPEEENIDRLWA